MRGLSILVLLALLFTGLPSGIEAGEIRFTILHTADEHSALIPHSPAADYRPGEADETRGGFARLAAAIEGQRAAREEPVLVLSAGDFLGGTMFSWLALEGEAPELSLMAQMGYDAVAIGNHEFDYGPEVLADYLKAAGYPGRESPALLGANTKIPEDHRLSEMGIRDRVLLPLPGGIRVGVFGLMGDDAALVTAHPGPVVFTDQKEAATQAVEDLRAEGADVIVALTHSGLEEDRLLAREVEGIDVIVGGHCHTPLSEPVVEADTIIVQSGPHVEYLGVLELALSGGEVRVVNAERGTAFLHPIDSAVGEDDEIKDQVDRYLLQVSGILESLTGRALCPLEPAIRLEGPLMRKARAENPVGNLIADALRFQASEILGEPVDFAFQASGQIRGDLVPGRDGHVSVYDLAATSSLGRSPSGLPGYPLVIVYLTGEEVIRVLEISALLSEIVGESFFLHVSGLRYEYDPDRAVLVNLPVLEVPVPTYRSVLRVETAEGAALRRGDESLYSVVTDLYVAGFVPMVGDLLPRLAITPRDAEGRAVEPDRAIITRNGRELLAWEVLLDYVSAQERGADGVPVLGERYGAPDGRARAVGTFPLWVWAAMALGLLAAGVVFGLLKTVRWWRRRGRAGGAAGSD